MNNVFYEYYQDEQCFLHMVLGVKLHPKFQVYPKYMNSERIFYFVQGGHRI